MARKDIQWKAGNNLVAGDGWVRGVIAQADCPNVDEEFYVCTVPKGVVLTDIKAFTYDVEDADNEKVDIKVDIGTHDCNVCTVELTDISAKKAVCCDDCKCNVISEDVPVMVTLKKKLETGNLMVLIGYVDPDAIVCRVDGVVPDTKQIILDHCTTDICDKEC